MKLKKLMIGGKWQKVNGKFIRSNGYFAYDGCHKFYLLEDEKDIADAMYHWYTLIPTDQLKETWDEAKCQLKFIHNWKTTKDYVKQFGVDVWTEKKATERELKEFSEEYDKEHPMF